MDERSAIREWAERECAYLDVVASWETLCEVYDQLRFTDPISDAVRIEEFRWVIAEVNKFLTRFKKKVVTCRTIEDAIDLVSESMSPQGTISLDQRRKVAYHKLRQRWLSMAGKQLTYMMEKADETEKEEPYA